MSSKICLCESVTFRTGLSYDEACSLMEAASKSPAAEFIEFSMTLGDEGCEGWSFKGMCRSLAEEFLKNPKGFIIEE